MAFDLTLVVCLAANSTNRKPAHEEVPVTSTSAVPQLDTPMAEHEDGPPLKGAKLDEEGLGSVVASHYNNLEEKGLKERSTSRIFHLRNSNNWIKSYLINYCLDQVRERQVDHYPVSVFDLGCGKGGDLLKWSKGNIRHLVCADIAQTSMDQCRERYTNTRKRTGGGHGGGFTAEFIVADCTKKRIKPMLENPSRQVDLVSCQFAFHYCFESLAQAETMLRNVSENLKRGGYFMATIPNAYEIMSRLKSSGSHRFGNEVYTVEFPEDRPEDPPIFGDRYNFFLEGVVDCPEFLVHPPTLIKLAKKWDLELEWKRDFSTVYSDALKDTLCQRLLSVMNVLETYPSKEEQVTETEVEYTHARQFLESREGVTAIRTLTSSEWEALCIYQAWVFRKSSNKRGQEELKKAKKMEEISRIGCEAVHKAMIVESTTKSLNAPTCPNFATHVED
ncbi:hypothetical protein Pcinc_000963 [Petrolisthes cinctipes]|uniref:mRNA (guanine-N(7))-methyltransferase n=1 Tax=Petrolisthes cinctipes TaxID=88211 RepID=A0AAE1GLR5_PETCI|nr:hypothetical protein Pcinc_000963 [Petrolisthes cinctipes]